MIIYTKKSQNLCILILILCNSTSFIFRWVHPPIYELKRLPLLPFTIFFHFIHSEQSERNFSDTSTPPGKSLSCDVMCCAHTKRRPAYVTRLAFLELLLFFRDISRFSQRVCWLFYDNCQVAWKSDEIGNKNRAEGREKRTFLVLLEQMVTLAPRPVEFSVFISVIMPRILFRGGKEKGKAFVKMYAPNATPWKTRKMEANFCRERNIRVLFAHCFFN